jgi:hypothetical protein
MPAIASRFRMFGVESRSSVSKIGPSSCNLVRAATGRAGDGLVTTAGEKASAEFASIRSLMGARPLGGWSSGICDGAFLIGRLHSSDQLRFTFQSSPTTSISSPAATHHFSHLY